METTLINPPEDTQSAIFQQLIQSRRSVRKYDQTAAFDHQAVSRSLDLAILSPNSSNMQLWQFHRIIGEQTRSELADICMGQKAAITANELVAFVVTPDKWRPRAQMNAKNVRKAFEGREDAVSKRALKYYEKFIPILYKNDRFGLFGLFRKLWSAYLGLKKPSVREVGKSDLRVSLHKSSSLAAMTFMTAMRAEGYDTYPMEGFDSKRAKALLGLEKNAEITMIISCGSRTEDGIYSERQRVSRNDVVFTH